MSRHTETTNYEDWMQSKWRPLMGYMYMAVCIFDFILFPIFWSMIQALDHAGVITSQWQPLTLQGAGLFHVAMGAVLGIAAYGRTQEKLGGILGQGTVYQQTPLAPVATQAAPVSPVVVQPTVVETPKPPVFETPVTSTPVITGYKGKKAPPPLEGPEL